MYGGGGCVYMTDMYGGGVDGGYCCCNDGYMYDGRDCVACAAGSGENQNTSLTYNSSCEDNRVIDTSDFWPSCGRDQHACELPRTCCCDSGFQWTDESGCAPCENGTCADNLPILGSDVWWWKCREAHYHLCTCPMAESGPANSSAAACHSCGGIPCRRCAWHLLCP